MGGAILAALGLIGLGLVRLFGRDFLWELTQFEYDWEGVASERTPAWETGAVLGGIVALAPGALVLALALFA